VAIISSTPYTVTNNIMRVSAYVLLAAFATSSPSSAFTPCSLYTAHQQTHQRTTTSRSAKDEKPSKQGAAEGSAKEAAAAATGTGLSASKAVPFVAPLAALAAGRQAMTKRELIRQEQIITEADLARIKKELANTDTAISVRVYDQMLAVALHLNWEQYRLENVVPD